MSFARAMDFTLAHEGGWYDGSQPHDLNPTMQGVTQKSYDAYRAAVGLPKQTVRRITRPELDAIYRSYWDAANCDAVGNLTSMALFEHAINAGPVTAVKVLQRALGVSDDGKFGPITRAAIASHADQSLALRMLWERLRYYHRLARPSNSRHRQSLPSWLGRTLALRDLIAGQ
jgi:lysozyme family protein